MECDFHGLIFSGDRDIGAHEVGSNRGGKCFTGEECRLQFARGNHAAVATFGINHHCIMCSVFLSQFKKRGPRCAVKNDYPGRLCNLAYRNLSECHEVSDHSLTYA